MNAEISQKQAQEKSDPFVLGLSVVYAVNIRRVYVIIVDYNRLLSRLLINCRLLNRLSLFKFADLTSACGTDNGFFGYDAAAVLTEFGDRVGSCRSDEAILLKGLSIRRLYILRLYLLPILRLNILLLERLRLLLSLLSGGSC